MNESFHEGEFLVGWMRQNRLGRASLGKLLGISRQAVEYQEGRQIISTSFIEKTEAAKLDFESKLKASRRGDVVSIPQKPDEVNALKEKVKSLSDQLSMSLRINLLLEEKIQGQDKVIKSIEKAKMTADEAINMCLRLEKRLKMDGVLKGSVEPELVRRKD